MGPKKKKQAKQQKKKNEKCTASDDDEDTNAVTKVDQKQRNSQNLKQKADSRSRSKSPELKDKQEKKIKTDSQDKPVNDSKNLVDPSLKSAVDPYLYRKDEFHVFCQENKKYSATMNYSKLGPNNNKYYIIQVLQNNQKNKEFYFYKRWGRVGDEGDQCFQGPITEQEALQLFQEKHKDKIERCQYKELQIKYDNEGQEQKQTEFEKEEEEKKSVAVNNIERQIVKCNLPLPVQNLIKLIFDLKIMENTMQEIGYDPKKQPLGQLGNDTIKEAYGVLNRLMNSIKSNEGKKQYNELSSEFFSLIPHNIGKKKLSEFVIDNEEKLKDKLDMLAALSDMKIANSFIKEIQEGQQQIDANYNKLKCKIRPIEKNEGIYEIILDFINNTKQNQNAQIIDVFEIDREGEEQRFDKGIGNNMLLWHGSRVSNFGGILSQGLRIAPPEAPVSGYLYGKGLYFADLFGKSANYCRANASNNECLILLVKVAIGKQNVLERTDYNAGNLPPGCNSAFAWGTMGPSESTFTKFEDFTVPSGKPKRTRSKHYMEHNEYIVYNVNQAQLKYLIRMKLG